MNGSGGTGPGVTEHALRAFRGVGSKWTDDDGHALRMSIGRAVTRRQRTRAAMMVCAPLAGVAALVMVARGGLVDERVVAPPVVAQAGAPAQTMLLTDGTAIEPVDAETVIEAASGRADVALGRGGARFRVSPARASRAFRVTAGAVTVEVVGTVFTVDRRGDSVEVFVDQGRGTVVFPGGQRVLSSGERAVFPMLAAPAEAPAAVAPAEPTVADPPRRSSTGWRSLARAGRYDAAYRALERAPDPVRDEPADLMLAADVARLSHHPEQAVRPLRRLFEQYPSDDRASPAAFLLGRLYLENLGQPVTAADAFARARGLAPRGALAEDALAREVEARVRAGDRVRAEALAAEYVRRFPQGARRAAIEDLVRGAAR